MTNLNHKYSTTENHQSYPKTKIMFITDLSPFQSPMIVDRTVDAPRDTAEPPEVGDDGEHDEAKDDRFCALGETPGREDEVVEHVGCHEDGKVECRELARVRRCVGKIWPSVRKEEDKKERDVHSGECMLHGP